MQATKAKPEFSINAEQGLYVIPSGSGYSCLGFDVAERWARGVLAWLPEGARPRFDAALGTAEHYNQYLAVMHAGGKHAVETKTRCSAQLTPQLIGLEGKRVEVTTPDGDRRRFYVGKSTGWLPIHLEIARRDSTGGMAVYLPEGSTVRVVGSR